MTNASNDSSIVTCIRCHENVFTEPLPSDERVMGLQSLCLAKIGDIHVQTRPDGRDLWSIPLRWGQVP
jgi:hypothetical protein